MPASIPQREYERIAHEYSGRIVIIEGVEGEWRSYEFFKGRCIDKRESESRFDELGFQFDIIDCKEEYYLPERCNMTVRAWSICTQEANPEQDNYIKKLNGQ